MRTGQDKRSALVVAAAEQFHLHGVEKASLAAVARTADIPPGNVYYYFRTKADLARGVADHWSDRVSESLAEIDGVCSDPIDRIRRFLDRARGRAETYAHHGCPLAGLTRDARHVGLPPLAVAEPLEHIMRWLGEQLKLAGDEHAARHATFILSALQGAYALAHARGSTDPVGDVVTDLTEWLSRQFAEARS